MSDSTALPPLPLSSPSLSPERSPKDKQESLNVLSPSMSSGPRPLHLPLGSVIGSSTSPSTPHFSSSYLSPGPSSSIAESDVDADHRSSPSNVTSANKSSPTQKATTTSRSASRPVPPPPLSPSISGLRKHNSRRQSSISYISSSPSPNGHSPSSSQFTFNNKRQSVDAAATLVRSPLSSVHPTFGDAFESNGGSGLARSNSLGGGVSRAGRGSKSPRSPNIGERERDRDRSSTGSIVPGQNMKHLKQRPPVTLAEKHAELLHFIAQKESKCLELRSQLAVHEAELLQLKRKWERIVNRGFEKALSPISTTASSSSNISNTSHKPTLPSHGPLSNPPDDNTSFSSSSSITSSPPSSSSYPAAGAGAGAAVVLEGIKESVQGVSRLIAAGLESIVNVGPPNASSSENARSASASDSLSTTSTVVAPPLPLKLGSAPTSSIKNKRQSYLGHEQKESQSSSGSSTRTSGTFSSLLSAGSAASTATSTNSSASASTSGIDNATGANHSSSASDASTTKEPDADDEFGDFETGQPASRSSPNSSMDDEQVLMVHDTGATPTMSPNPAFEKRRRKGERVPVQVEKLVLTPGDGLGDKEQRAEELSWDDDAWGDSEQPLSSSLSSAASSQGYERRSQPQAQAQPRQKQQSQPPQPSHSTSSSNGPKSPLAPMSSIPGLSMGMNMSMNAPSAQQVSSWVGSVGKKWGEIAKGGSTFVKNQKRASVLLSDMQQSIVSALGSPVSLSGTPQTASSLNTKTSSTSTSSQTPSTPSFSSNASHTSYVASSSASSSLSYHNSTSLLDGSDDESYGENSIVGINITPVMVPDSLNGRAQAGPASKTPQVKKAATGGVKENEDEDEWNW